MTKFEVNAEGKEESAGHLCLYHLELCTICNLCIEACPTNAIKMAQSFRTSVYDRRTHQEIEPSGFQTDGGRGMSVSAFCFMPLAVLVLTGTVLSVTSRQIFRSAIFLLFS